jgi:Zn-dependent protease
MAISDPPATAPTRQNQPHQWAFLGLLLVGVGWFLVRNGSLGRDQVIYFGVLIPSIILHEVSHGAVALLFGDTTAKRAGRLTLNPFKHIDPFWTILVPAMMVFYAGQAFGMAKPVPVDPSAMRHPRNHGLLTSLAGPATNIALAALAWLLFRGLRLSGTAAEVVALFGLANVILAVFNLLPIPPLDGSAVVERLLPRRWLPPYLRLRRHSFFLFVGLFLLAGDLLGRVLQPAVDLWFRLLFA